MESAGIAGRWRFGCTKSVLHHFRNSIQRLDCSDKDRLTRPLFASYDVRTEMHSIREVDVEVAAIPEHHIVSLSSSAIGVGSRIVLAIRLCLNNTGNQSLSVVDSNDVLAKQVPRNLQSWTQIE